MASCCDCRSLATAAGRLGQLALGAGASGGFVALSQVRWKTIRASQHRRLERAQQTTVQHFGFDNVDRVRFREHGKSTGSIQLRQVTALVRDCARRGDFEAGWSAYRGAEAGGDAALTDAVLALCGRALWRTKAYEVWDGMPVEWRSVVSYSTMIDVAARCKRPQDAERLLEEMRGNGLAPNIITYTALVKAFASAGQVDKARAAFEEMRPTMADASTQGKQMAYQVVLAAVARAGDYAAAREIFEDMQQAGVPPDRGHYHSLLAACARNGDGETALGIFRFMRTAGLSPDVQTYTALTSCCRNDLRRCLELREEMRNAGILVNNSYLVELTEAHILAGDRHGAQRSLDETRGLDPRSRKVIALLRELRSMR